MKSLKLVYRGKVLEDGDVFDDYEWRKERWKWSKPYAVRARPLMLPCVSAVFHETDRFTGRDLDFTILSGAKVPQFA